VINNSFETVFIIGLSESELGSQHLLSLRLHHSAAALSRKIEALIGIGFISFVHD
jgi:hypothetical protein